MPRDLFEESKNTSSVSQSGPRDLFASPEKESLSTSVLLAAPRIGEDILKGGYEFAKKIPGYYESAKTEIPNALNSFSQHPKHSLNQALAGISEFGQNVFNTPHDIANYTSNRLNLLPQGINEKIQMARMPDSSEEINKTFGYPKYPGDELIRGTGRNALNLLAGSKVASILNPMNLTSNRIAKKIIDAGEKNKNIYGGKYEKLWKDAVNEGFDNALYNVDIDMKTLKKFSPEKSIKGVHDFNINPTLKNAHAAKSDLLRIQRDLNKLPTLRSAERQQLKAVNEAIDSIKSNMFKDSKGNLNKNMLNQYEKIQKGYSNDVIPYKNNMINKYKRKEITSKELINSLSKGEFAAKKGFSHKDLKIRNYLLPALGVTGMTGGGAYLYDKITGK